MIIMLNLLIAILGNSFNTINDSAIQASYQERARMISENSFLIPPVSRKKFCPPNTYLIVAESESHEVKNEDEDEQH